jgi:hypothetical protein
MLLILHTLATIGLTFIITLSSLFKPLRDWTSRWIIGKLFHCPMCFGFWAGLLNYLLIFQTFNWLLIPYAFLGSFVSYTAYLLLRYFMDKYD